MISLFVPDLRPYTPLTVIAHRSFHLFMPFFFFSRIHRNESILDNCLDASSRRRALMEHVPLLTIVPLSFRREITP